jgi:Ca-activated chloride channel family protein
MRFASPWMFLLLVAVPAVFLWLRRSQRSAWVFPTLDVVGASGTSLRQRLLPLVPLLRAVAIILIVVALARPQFGVEKVRDISQGIAIEMVVDRSSSMSEEMFYKGRTVTRLDVVKSVFRDFVDSGGDLPGRPTDLVGMITFARFPDTICPLTLSHDALETLINNVALVQRRPEDGTAVGDAVALAAARLYKAEESLAEKTGKPTNYQIKSKIIILLTDGQNNAGQRTVEQAAELSKEWGVKVYAIGVGDTHRVSTAYGSYPVANQPGVEDESLRALAETTGGTYRIATDSESLVEIYQEIDALEKSEIQSLRYLDYRELFPSFALAALLLLALELTLSSTILRRVP